MTFAGTDGTWKIRQWVPGSTKASLHQRLSARGRWPQIERINTRFRASVEVLPLCRLRHVGYANEWGLAIYHASHDDCQDNHLPVGLPVGTAGQAMDTACGLCLNGPTAWTGAPDEPTTMTARSTTRSSACCCAP